MRRHRDPAQVRESPQRLYRRHVDVPIRASTAAPAPPGRRARSSSSSHRPGRRPGPGANPILRSMTVSYSTGTSTRLVRLKAAGEPAVDTADTAYSKGQTSGTAAMVRRMTGASSPSTRARRRSLLRGRTGGNTADGSSIRPCSIRSRWATGLTSSGTPTSRSRSSKPRGDERATGGERPLCPNPGR
jgi:hypothetical protein